MKRYMPAVKRSSTTVSSSKSRPFKRRRVTKKSNNLGNITGRVRPSATTLAKAPGPFQGKKFVTFLYENELTAITGATNLLVAQVASNSMYDFDKHGGSCFGNKQPLYFDTLLSASGPYKVYKVISWKTTYTLVNTSNVPVTIWALPPIAATAEIDSAAEADNFPGVKRLYLTGSTGTKTTGTITVTGHVNDVYPEDDRDANLNGTYGTDPTNIIYGGIIVHGSDGTTAPNVYVAVKHEAYTELQYVDALVS